MNMSRTELLIGSDALAKLKEKKVTIVGVGGVGGYVAYMLTRAGVGNLTIIDFDTIASSNINRQIVANTKTIGQKKVQVLGKMLKEINPALNLVEHDERVTKDNVCELISSCDFCIDAIDSVSDKVALIVHCKKNNIPVISAMGSGNRVDVPRFYLTDIYKTHDDGLARVMRKKLREEGVTELEVVIAETKAMSVQANVVGSISYYPAMCGITMAAIAINKFLGGNYEANK